VGALHPLAASWLQAWFLLRVLRRFLQATPENVEIMIWSIIIIIIICCRRYRFVMQLETNPSSTQEAASLPNLTHQKSESFF
jgi:hypothetical protein